MDRTKRAAASMFSGSLFALLSTALGFWATPAIVRALGGQQFGLSRALIDAFGYVTLLEFGLAGASRAFLATEVASDRPERVAAGLQLTLRAHLRAMRWKLLASVAMIVVCPFLLHADQADTWQLRIGAAVLAFVVLGTPVGALQALLSAEQRDYSNNLAIGLQNIIITCSAVLFAWLRWGIAGQMVAQALGFVFLWASVVWLTRKSLQLAWSAQGAPDSETLIAFGRLNRATFWRMLAGRLALMSDRLIVGVMLGGSAVTSFHATVRLTDAILPQIFGIGNSAWPAMVDIYHRGDTELFAKRLSEVTMTICGASIALTAPIITGNGAFVAIWLGPQYFAGWTLTVICCLNALLLSLIAFWEWCFHCTQKVEAILPVTLLACSVNVIASILGAWRLGAAGPALGTTLSTAFVVIPWEIHLIYKHFRVPAAQLLWAIGKPMAIGLPYLAACHWFGRHFLRASWLSIGSAAALSTGLWLLVAWFTVFDEETRRLWRARVARLVSRFS